MTVLEHNPVASDGTTLDVGLGCFFHTLTKGQKVELAHSNSDILNQFLHFSLRVSTRTQDEDDWSLLCRLLQHLFVYDRRGLDVEIVLHALNDKAFDSIHHAIGSEDSANKQSLELVIVRLFVVSAGEL